MKLIVTLSGQAQHGKDTTAQILKEYFESQAQRVIVIPFGDYLKFLATKHFGYTGNHHTDLKERELLQWLGTEVGRTNNPGFWVRIVRETLLALSTEFDVALIPDCRFIDEGDVLKETFKVFNLMVERPGFDNQLGERKNHISEHAWREINFDTIIQATTIEELKANVLNVFTTQLLGLL